MLHLINIHWTRRTPREDKPSKGHSTYAERARTFNAAKSKAVRKFNRHYGLHLAIEKTTELDPARALVS